MKYFSEVLEIANKLHADDYLRGGKVPYIIHPIRVSMKVYDSIKDVTCDEKHSETMIYSSLLHDVVNSGHVNLNILQSMLVCKLAETNRNVDYNEITAISVYTINIVMALSRVLRTESNYNNLNLFYAKQISSAGFPSMLIKLCDIEDNIENMTEITKEFRHIYVEKATVMLTEFNIYIVSHTDSPLRPAVIKKYDEVTALVNKLLEGE